MAVVADIRKEDFIATLTMYGGPVAVQRKLPVAAMVACAIMESGYGTSKIYGLTGCPFNLQKPSHFTWVNCRVMWLTTSTQTDDAGRPTHPLKAPFCVAEGTMEGDQLADAARLWCEWIEGWPQPGVRQRLLAQREKPEAFTALLPTVGFGEANKSVANGKRFVGALRQHSLVSRCNEVLSWVEPG